MIIIKQIYYYTHFCAYSNRFVYFLEIVELLTYSNLGITEWDPFSKLFNQIIKSLSSPVVGPVIDGSPSPIHQPINIFLF